jgi:hypothetical protein|tara:strand:- start:30631 stop:30771 length:141 start_codon:yes stop_codon:yes gene_type:complete
MPTRPFHVLRTPDRGMTPRLKSFLDFTLAKFGENPAKATWPKAASG